MKPALSSAEKMSSRFRLQTPGMLLKSFPEMAANAWADEYLYHYLAADKGTNLTSSQ